MKGQKIHIFLIFALVFSTIFLGYFYTKTSRDLAELRAKYEVLQKQYSELNGSYQALLEDYESLKSEYSSLVRSYKLLHQNYTSLKSEYYVLSAKYDYLNRIYQALLEDYEALNADYIALKSEYNSLSKSYELLHQSYTTLKSKYQTLLTEYDSLNQSYYIVLKTLEKWKLLHIGTTLETYYDYVRANVVSIGFIPVSEERWYLFPGYYNLSVQFAAKIAAHDAGNLYWPSLEEGSRYYEYSGEYSYQTAYKILKTALILANVTVFDSDTEKIDKILRFVSSVVHYEHRLIDHMWFPTETLTFRSGDCTSFSILVAALLEMSGVKSAIGFFENDEGDKHAMVLIHLKDLEGYSYYYYSDLTDWGLTAGRWIIVEPQFSSLSEQEQFQESWIPQWNLIAVAEVPYGP